MIYVEVLVEELPVANFMVNETVPLQAVTGAVAKQLKFHTQPIAVTELTENRVLVPELSLREQGVTDGCILKMEVDHAVFV